MRLICVCLVAFIVITNFSLKSFSSVERCRSHVREVDVVEVLGFVNISEAIFGLKLECGIFLFSSIIHFLSLCGVVVELVALFVCIFCSEADPSLLGCSLDTNLFDSMVVCTYCLT